MDSLCTACLATDLELETITELRLKTFFRQIVADFTEYEVPQNLPRLCSLCSTKLTKAASFKDQAIHSYVILQEIHQQEIVLSANPQPRKKKVDMAVQTEESKAPTELRDAPKVSGAQVVPRGPNCPKMAQMVEPDIHSTLIDIEPQIFKNIIQKSIVGMQDVSTQTLPHILVNKQINKLESKKKNSIAAQTEDTPKICNMESEPLEQIDKLKVQNQNLLRLLKRLQKDSQTTSKVDDTPQVSESQDSSFTASPGKIKGSPRRNNEIITSPVVHSKIDDTLQVSKSSQDSSFTESPTKIKASPRRNTITSPVSSRKCDPNEVLNRIKILDVRVLTEEFKIQEPEEGPIVISRHSLKEVIEIQDPILSTDSPLVNEDVVDMGIPLDFESEEDDSCAIADDDRIWESLDTDIAYPEIEMKQENEEVDVEGLYLEGREESVTPNTDDLLPDLQSSSDSDTGGSGASGSESEEEEDSNKSVLSEYCNKKAVVVLNDIMMDSQSLLTERSQKKKDRTKQNQPMPKTFVNCYNCPHCKFMKNKLLESNKGKEFQNETNCNNSINSQLRKRLKSSPQTNLPKKAKLELKEQTKYMFSQSGVYLRCLTTPILRGQGRGRGRGRGSRGTSMVRAPGRPIGATGKTWRRGRGRKPGNNWERKRIDQRNGKCYHCKEIFSTNEELKRHILEVVGADASQESVEVSEVQPTEVKVTVNEKESKEEPPEKQVKTLQVIVEDVLKKPDTNRQTDTPMDVQDDSLICNHCEKEFKSKKKLREHILDIALSDCHRSLDDLWQT